MAAGKVSARELRRVLGSGVPEVVAQLAHNDTITQGKVTALEAKAEVTDAFLGMTFKQRVLWLLRGVN